MSYQLEQAAALVAQAFEAGVLGAEHVAVTVADEAGLRAVDVEAGAGCVDEAGGSFIGNRPSLAPYGSNPSSPLGTSKFS